MLRWLRADPSAAAIQPHDERQARLADATHPRGHWTIDDLATVAARFGIDVAPGKGSHRVFRFPDGSILSVPTKRPIKAVYIKQFTDKLVE